MLFTVEREIEASHQSVFDATSDFSAIEARLRRRGREVRRLDDADGIGPGAAWIVGLHIGGRARELRCELVRLDPPRSYEVTATSSGLEGVARVMCTALSETRTRIALRAEICARTISGRLLLQPMKLAKPAIENRLAALATGFAQEVEARCQQRSRA